MKSKADKCHLLVTRDTDVTAKIEEFDVKNSREEELRGVKKDSKFYFENMFLLLQKGRPKVTCTHKSCKFYGSSKT